jgi:hypothetical protein
MEKPPFSLKNVVPIVIRIGMIMKIVKNRTPGNSNRYR